MKQSSVIVILIGFAIQVAVPRQTYGQNAGAGIVDGYVVDDAGLSVEGASIQYIHLHAPATTVMTPKGSSAPPPSGPLEHGSIASDASGHFQIRNLSEGDYRVCASVAGSAYLDPCVWGPPIRISVGSNATTSLRILFSKGVLLNVRINDSGGLLTQAADSPIKRAKLLVGVIYASGAYQSAVNDSVDSTGRNYSLAVPANVPFNLRVFSRDVTLTDQAGKAVDVSGMHPIPFQTVSDQNQTYIFTTHPLN